MKPSEYIQKGWCQNVNALDAENKACNPWSPYATKWCLVGAIHAAYPSDALTRIEVTTKIREVLHSPHISGWNDLYSRKQA